MIKSIAYRLTVQHHNDGIATHESPADYIDATGAGEVVQHITTGGLFARIEGRLYQLPDGWQARDVYKAEALATILSNPPAMSRALAKFMADRWRGDANALALALGRAAKRGPGNVAALAAELREHGGAYLFAEDMRAALGTSYDLAGLPGVLVGYKRQLTRWRVYARLGVPRDTLRALKDIARAWKLQARAAGRK